MGCTPLLTLACGPCTLSYRISVLRLLMMEYVRSHPGAIPWKLILSSAFTSSFEITMAYATIAYLNDWLLFDRHPLGDKWGASQSWFLLISWCTWVSRSTTVRWRYSSYLLCTTSLSIYFGTRDKDPWRIACYTQWIFFNLQLPHFLAKDILLGDPTQVLATLCNLSVLSYNPSSLWMD